MSHKPGSRLPLLSTRPAVTPTTLKGLLPVLLLGEQRHNGCEQFESRNITPRQVEELARDGGGALFVSRAAEAQGLYTTELLLLTYLRTYLLTIVGVICAIQ